MTFDEYQKAAGRTAIYPTDDHMVALYYAALGLAGEAGEVAGEVSKAIRDDECRVTPERLDKLRGEAGDVLWHLSALCDRLGVDLGEVARANLCKLADRQRRGAIGGSGGNR